MSELIKEQIQLPATYSLNAESETARNELALQARPIIDRGVLTPQDQELAVASVRSIKAYVTSVREMRMSITRKFDSAKALLMELESDNVSPLIELRDELECELTKFDQREQSRVDAALAERTSTTSREAELKAAVEESQDRIDAAKNEAELRKAVSDQIASYEALSALHSAIMAPLPSKAKVAGAYAKPKLCWRVTDIAKLYASRPDLCTIEAKASAINSCCVPEMPVEGLHLWWEQSFVVRK